MKKKIITMLLFLALLITPLTTNAENITVQQFIDMHKSDVIAIAKEKDLFASVMMAQAILESGSGNSTLASSYNNYFGMKGHGVVLGTIEYDSVETSASFQVFESPIDSFRAYAENFYKNDMIYSKFLTATDPNSAARALDGVYATTSNYSQQLISLMTEYNLYSLDVEAEKITYNDISLQEYDSPEYAEVKKNVEELEKKRAEEAKIKEELEKKNLLINSYKDSSKMIKAKTKSIARRLYKNELKKISNIVTKNLSMFSKFSGEYYTIDDIAKLYNKTQEEAKILYNSYKNESIEATYGNDAVSDNMVKSLSFNKYMAEVVDKTH